MDDLQNNQFNKDIKKYTFEYIMRNQFGVKGCHPNDLCVSKNRVYFVYPYFEDFSLKEGDKIILGSYRCSEVLLCEITRVITHKKDMFGSIYDFNVINHLYKLSENKWGYKKNLKYIIKYNGKLLFKFLQKYITYFNSRFFK